MRKRNAEAGSKLRRDGTTSVDLYRTHCVDEQVDPEDSACRCDAAVAPFFQALQDCGCCELRSVEVQVLDDRLLITGKVSSFYLKQVAQELVAQVAGVTQVINKIGVCTGGGAVRSSMTLTPLRPTQEDVRGGGEHARSESKVEAKYSHWQRRRRCRVVNSREQSETFD